MAELPKGSRRGTGKCGNKLCSKSYTNRWRPKYCECGYYLGGTYEPSSKKAKIEPSPIAVKVFMYEENGNTFHYILFAQRPEITDSSPSIALIKQGSFVLRKHVKWSGAVTMQAVKLPILTANI